MISDPAMVRALNGAAERVYPEQYEMYETIILSDQIPLDHLAQLFLDNPDFAAWYRSRAAQRQS